MKSTSFFLIGIFSFLINSEICFAQSKLIPHIVKKGSTKQLIVDGEPMLMLAGEVRNSSSGNKIHMDSTWSILKAMNLNTVIGSLSWQLIEPAEGKFDMHWVDDLVNGAREHDLKLVLIWFASYKNSYSTYVPEWVKKDNKRFPLSIKGNGEKINRLSEFYESSMKADAKAFARVMEHINKIDKNENTVIMVQVENESGMLGDSRDRTTNANAAFKRNVPEELLQSLQQNLTTLHPYILQHWAKSNFAMEGNWEEVFGKGPVAEEIFSAWHLAKYIDYVTNTGKEAYNLPMYVNSWLAGNSKPGDYPTGGPVARLIDIWKGASNNIDLYAPDIYDSSEEFKNICQEYKNDWNPLFIPESSRNDHSAFKTLYVLGEFSAMGMAPFAVDDPDFIGNKNITEGYGILKGMLPFIAKYQGTDKIRGFLYSGRGSEIIELDGAQMKIIYNRHELPDGNGGGLIIKTEKGDYIAAGSGVTIEILPQDKNKPNVNFLDVFEGRFEDGEWIPEMCLNGDELHLELTADYRQTQAINLPPSHNSKDDQTTKRFSIQKFNFVYY